MCICSEASHLALFQMIYLCFSFGFCGEDDPLFSTWPTYDIPLYMAYLFLSDDIVLGIHAHMKHMHAHNMMWSGIWQSMASSRGKVINVILMRKKWQWKLAVYPECFQWFSCMYIPLFIFVIFFEKIMEELDVNYFFVSLMWSNIWFRMNFRISHLKCIGVFVFSYLTLYKTRYYNVLWLTIYEDFC